MTTDEQASPPTSALAPHEMIKLVRAAARATFAPMNADFRDLFSGAEDGTLMAQDDEAQLTMLLAPNGELSFIGTDDNFELYEIRLTASVL